MRMKLLLLLCSLFVIGKWASAHDICLQRKARPNPMEIPVFPPTEKCTILSSILNISFDKIEDYATVAIMNKKTGEIVHFKIYYNTSIVIIDMSSCEKGEYTIHITLDDCLLEGTFTVQ